MTDGVLDPNTPTAVRTKLVLTLIVAHVEGDNHRFMETALEVADELRMMGKHDLADYILAQYKLIPTFETMD